MDIRKFITDTISKSIYPTLKSYFTASTDRVVNEIKAVKPSLKDVGVTLKGIDLVAIKGEKGDKGDKGDKGEKGKDGQDGEDGYTPIKFKDYFTKKEIADIVSEIEGKIRIPQDGIQGEKGADGYTPIAGTDYPSRRQIEDYVNEMVANIPPAVDGFAPKHEWKGSKLRFENPDGSWGDWTELAKVSYGGGGISEISNASDVVLSNVKTNDVLKYDAISGKWKNGTAVSSDEKVKYNAADASAGYLADKTTAGTNIELSESSDTLSIKVADIPTFDGIKYDTSVSAPSYAYGQTYWDSAAHTLAIQTSAHTTLQIGQETVAYCRNNSGVNIADGDVVRMTGATGNFPTIALAQANAESTSYPLGVATQAIADDGFGFVTIRGVVHGGVDTSAFDEGDLAYLSVTTAGKLQKTEPDAPNHAVIIGRVLKDASNGDLYVNVNQGHELSELHDVDITGTPSGGDVLKFNAVSGVWENDAETDPLSLHLDQTTPQTVINGAPIMDEGITLGPNKVVTPVTAGLIEFDGTDYYVTI